MDVNSATQTRIRLHSLGPSPFTDEMTGIASRGPRQAGINDALGLGPDTIDFRFRFSAESKSSAFGRPLIARHVCGL